MYVYQVRWSQVTQQAELVLRAPNARVFVFQFINAKKLISTRRFNCIHTTNTLTQQKNTSCVRMWVFVRAIFAFSSSDATVCWRHLRCGCCHSTFAVKLCFLSLQFRRQFFLAFFCDNSIEVDNMGEVWKNGIAHKFGRWDGKLDRQRSLATMTVLFIIGIYLSISQRNGVNLGDIPSDDILIASINHAKYLFGRGGFCCVSSLPRMHPADFTAPNKNRSRFAP